MKHVYDNPYVLLTLTPLFWAGNTIAGKLASGVIPPYTLAFLRWVLVLAIVWPLARPFLREYLPTIQKHAVLLLIMGALGFSLFNISLYSALTLTSAINVAIEQSAFPAVIMILMFVIYRERITAIQAVGVAVAMVGVIITAAQGSLDILLALAFNQGDLIMMVGVVFYSLFSILLRKKPPMPWQVLMLMLALGGVLAATPYFAIDLIEGRYPAADWRVIALLAYVVIFPSFISQMFWVRGVELIGPNRASVFINLIPVFGTAMAIVILGERLQAYHVVGLSCVIGGIMIAEWAGRRSAQRLAAAQ